VHPKRIQVGSRLLVGGGKCRLRLRDFALQTLALCFDLALTGGLGFSRAPAFRIELRLQALALGLDGLVRALALRPERPLPLGVEIVLQPLADRLERVLRPLPLGVDRLLVLRLELALQALTFRFALALQTLTLGFALGLEALAFRITLAEQPLPLFVERLLVADRELDLQPHPLGFVLALQPLALDVAFFDQPLALGVPLAQQPLTLGVMFLAHLFALRRELELRRAAHLTARPRDVMLEKLLELLLELLTLERGDLDDLPVGIGGLPFGVGDALFGLAGPLLQFRRALLGVRQPLERLRALLLGPRRLLFRLRRAFAGLRSLLFSVGDTLRRLGSLLFRDGGTVARIRRLLLGLARELGGLDDPALGFGLRGLDLRVGLGARRRQLFVELTLGLGVRLAACVGQRLFELRLERGKLLIERSAQLRLQIVERHPAAIIPRLDPPKPWRRQADPVVK